MLGTCEDMQCDPDEKCLQGVKKAYCVGNEVLFNRPCLGKITAAYDSIILWPLFIIW